MLTYASDTNTGIWFPSSDNLGFTVGGVDGGRFLPHATTAKPQFVIGDTAAIGFSSFGIKNTHSYEAIAVNSPSRASGTPNNDANGYIRFFDGANGSTFGFGGYNDGGGLHTSKRVLFDTSNNYNMHFGHDTAAYLRVTYQGNVVVGGNGALATSAANGFLYIPTCAGTPTGTPTTYTGSVALIFDTTANKLWVYDGGWLQTAALT